MSECVCSPYYESTSFVFPSPLPLLFPSPLSPLPSLLSPPPSHQSYTMRNGVLGVIGEVISQVLNSSQIDQQTKATRDKLLDRLEQHLHDVNAFVRSRCLQIWLQLCNAKVRACVRNTYMHVCVPILCVFRPFHCLVSRQFCLWCLVGLRIRAVMLERTPFSSLQTSWPPTPLQLRYSPSLSPFPPPPAFSPSLFSVPPFLTICRVFVCCDNTCTYISFAAGHKGISN